MPATKPPYPPEFRAEAVRLVRESGKKLQQIAADLGVSEASLRKWVRQAGIDAGQRPGLTTAEREELNRLRRENRILREEREILKKSRSLFCPGEPTEPVTVFRFIEQEKAHHPVATLCRVLGVSTSGYYAWRQRGASRRSQEDADLSQRIRLIHAGSRGTYGAPRIHAELRLTHGVRCGRKRVARLMRAMGLAGVHRRRTRGITLRDPRRPVYPDRLGRQFVPDAPNRVWVADLTQHRTEEGWLYLATVVDAFSRAVVGWAMGNRPVAELVVDAVTMAVRRRRPGPGLIHHSDHGVQYTSLAFTRRLEVLGIAGSMGSVGDALDNAMAESFYATLQRELLDRQAWATRDQLRMAIFEYVEGFYNRRRRHSALGYLSPYEYEERWIQERKAQPQEGVVA
ncbi:IS3 family transposase [Thermaerobacter sp. PB12/4term]|uniref:IS3 family transposase n=1 Tax=Thermaerobacter sp. PB12/4term TaxID=2293838 RepID=UPI00139753E8|nr:IS3 family transposase [Thermaerobacter sp. PB12/4term]QIA27781.1 IS3 family transposase [Thermaerobacter sp. PB12/4term]